MKKSKKIVLSIFCTLAVLLIVIASALAYFTSTAIVKTEADENLSKWMSYIKDETLLKSVVIPGSHDAGSKGMMWLTKTQNKDIKEQLADGVRYFDIRIQKDGDDFAAFHGPSKGLKADDIFRDIRDFISVNSTETLILDFQHFKGESEADVINFIDGYLSESVLRNNTEKDDVTFVDELTLGEARGKCLVFWGTEKGNHHLANDFVFLRNNDNGTRQGSALHSYYDYDLNILSPKNYIKRAVPNYIERYKEDGKGLFVLQGQLTDGFPILNHKAKTTVMGPQFQEARMQYLMSRCVITLKDSADLKYINIIMRDFLNATKSKEIISLNYYKNNVKSGLDGAFRSHFFAS